MFELKHW